MKFEVGDIVKNKYGRIDKIKSLPGCPEYDKQKFIAADRGMVLENDLWEFQKDWKILKKKGHKKKGHKNMPPNSNYQPNNSAQPGYSVGDIVNAIGDSGGERFVITYISGGGDLNLQSVSTGQAYTGVSPTRVMPENNTQTAANSATGYALIGQHQQVVFSSASLRRKVQQAQAYADALEEKEEKPELNEKELDAVVLPEESKKSILGLLKQHKNASKIFDEWGLGETIEYGRGMTFLFWGSPGTGKTWATHCIAKAIKKEIISIGAAEIQSSEPGGANRNIQEAFKKATEENKVLLIDECDSLITNRSEVGMILGGEINTLLTEIEKFEGVCILATNRIENLDEALERRIALIVEFQNPTFEERKKIWEKLIPKKMPLHENVNFESLAKAHLTGGQIKNAVLASAREALAEEKEKVELDHFERSVKRIQESRGLMGQERRQTVHVDYVKG